MNNFLLGLDIGGTKCAVVLAECNTDRPNIIGRRSFETISCVNSEDVLLRLEGDIHTLLKSSGLSASQVSRLGISCGGPLDSTAGVILSPPNLPGWDNVPIVKHFETALGIPTQVQNDADASALAEWRWGAGVGCRHLIFLTFGTGIGAGLILNGALYSGANGLAGEVGHVRLADSGPIGHGKFGSFEGFCSGGGLVQIGRSVAERYWNQGRTVSYCASINGIGSVTAKGIADAAYGGDPAALEVYDISSRHLGAGLAMLVDILDPEIIIIGGVFARSTELLWPNAEKILRAEALGSRGRDVRVVPAKLGDQIGDYAALAAGQYETGDSLQNQTLLSN